MKRSILFLSYLVIFSLVCVPLSLAGMINYDRRNRRTPPTGRARPAATPAAKPAATATAAPSLPNWMQNPPSVSNKTEGKYDTNRDGKLQSAEVKIYLRDVISVVESKGGHMIDSDILKAYDKNKDGVINRYELAEVKQDAAK